jgi:predicted RNase H-like nuclease
MDHLHISGFDSAWGGSQKGAICDLWIDKCTGTIEIDAPPVSVSWSEANQHAARYAAYAHHILAIDQSLVVPNDAGMRPVERLLAQALGDMECSAYPTNRSNESCYGVNAGIWSFLNQLQQHGYVHSPMSIPNSKSGRFYFECYPHPAIIALLNRTKVLKYKCRHRNGADWLELLTLMNSLPVNNLSKIVSGLAAQTKANEDKLDSIICAYTAVLWWQLGTVRSSMIGTLTDGYMVTPHSDETLRRFKKVFGSQMNDGSTPPPVPLPVGGHGPLMPPKPASATKPLVLESVQWSGPDELVATDTSNLSRNMRLRKGKPSEVINDWMDPSKFRGYRLIVKFLDEDAEPEVSFVPHSHSEKQQVLMADQEEQRELWFLLVAGAKKETPLRFRIKYKYLALP